MYHQVAGFDFAGDEASPLSRVDLAAQRTKRVKYAMFGASAAGAAVWGILFFFWVLRWGNLKTLAFFIAFALVIGLGFFAGATSVVKPTQVGTVTTNDVTGTPGFRYYKLAFFIGVPIGLLLYYLMMWVPAFEFMDWPDVSGSGCPRMACGINADCPASSGLGAFPDPYSYSTDNADQEPKRIIGPCVCRDTTGQKIPGCVSERDFTPEQWAIVNPGIAPDPDAQQTGLFTVCTVCPSIDVNVNNTFIEDTKTKEPTGELRNWTRMRVWVWMILPPAVLVGLYFGTQFLLNNYALQVSKREKTLLNKTASKKTGVDEDKISLEMGASGYSRVADRALSSARTHNHGTG